VPVTSDPRDSISYRQVTLRTSLNAAVEMTDSCEQRPTEMLASRQREEEENNLPRLEQEIKM